MTPAKGRKTRRPTRRSRRATRAVFQNFGGASTSTLAPRRTST